MKKITMLVSLLAITVTTLIAHPVTFDKIINDYISLKNSLVKDNGDSARNSSKILFYDLQEFKVDELTAVQKKVWNQFAEKISYDAEHIKGTSELEHQREHFVTLSANMFKLLKGLSMNSIKLYHQFCPMANDGKGAYWLSEKEEISNPYMGKKMPKCGSTKDSLDVK